MEVEEEPLVALTGMMQKHGSPSALLSVVPFSFSLGLCLFFMCLIESRTVWIGREGAFGWQADGRWL